IIRKTTLDKNGLQYHPDYPKAEDYKLWLEIADHKKLANIPEILHRYRIHNQQITRVDSNSRSERMDKPKQTGERKGIRQILLTDFLSRELTKNELVLHAKLFFEIPFMGKVELDHIREWVNYLKIENRKVNKYLEPNFSRLLDDRFCQTKAKSFKYYAATKYSRFNPKILWDLFFSDEQYYQSFSNRELTFIILNSLVLRKNRWYSAED
ncbi:MAG: hypothetical protein RI575_17835, partial [Balneolaceae bacterium]|nr:hypothetical protein [Balneolaceae bacterium]